MILSLNQRGMWLYVQLSVAHSGYYSGQWENHQGPHPRNYHSGISARWHLPDRPAACSPTDHRLAHRLFTLQSISNCLIGTVPLAVQQASKNPTNQNRGWSKILNVLLLTPMINCTSDTNHSVHISGQIHSADMFSISSCLDFPK